MLDSGVLFTDGERAHCHSRPDPYTSLAGLFSAKEAFVKALSSLGGAPAHTFPEVEVVHGPAGQPRIQLHGQIAQWHRQQRLAMEVSISHTGDLAGAVVVLLAEPARSGGPAS
ncbi:holo-ACP synthase [Streptomyces flavidovirens]|uniref:holo-ACP synthase n=1 Tax=Streptomyces flavidovirens TaxID=67298 RepID=UPI0006880D6F|nr:holo-ACP synthase [Streptomyces flavidovirens]